MLVSSLKLSMKVHHYPVLGQGTIYHNLLVEGSSQQDPVVDQSKNIFEVWESRDTVYKNVP
jgi:hypothetical protein